MPTPLQPLGSLPPARGSDLLTALNNTIRQLGTVNALLVPFTVQPPPVTQPTNIPTQQWIQTWNTATAQTALLLNVTDTSSPAASLLLDLQVGGVSKFSIRKDGLATIGPIAFTSLTISPGPLIVGTDPGGSELVRAASGRFTTLVGTLSTAAQPNITSLGTLTSLTVSGASVLQGGLTVGTNTGGGTVTLNAAVPTGGAIGTQVTFAAAGVARWLIRTDVDETGVGNAGSAWNILARDDAGAIIDRPIIIVRAAGGLMSLSRPVTIAGLVTASAALTVTGTLTLTTAASRLVPGATSFAIRNTANTVDNLLVKNAGEIDVVTGPLIIGTDPGAAGAASLVRIGGGLLVLGDPVPSASPAVTDNPGFRVGFTPAVFGGRLAVGGTVIIGHLEGTPQAGLAVVVTTSVDTAQYGIVSAPNFNASATGSGYCYNGRVEVDLFPHTMAVGAVYQAADGVVGAGAITTLYGLLIENLTVGGTNISIKTGTAPVIFGTDPGGSELLRVGGASRLNGTLTQIGGPIVFTNGAATSIGTSDNFGFSIKTNALVRSSWDTSGNQVADTTNGGYITYRAGTSSATAKVAGLLFESNNATTTSTTTATITGGSNGGTYTLKANTLAANGDSLRIVYNCHVSATTGTFTLTVGGSTIIGAVALSSNGSASIVVWLTRRDATHFDWTYEGLHFNAANVTDLNRADNVNVDLTTDQTINFQGSVAAGTFTAHLCQIVHEAA